MKLFRQCPIFKQNFFRLYNSTVVNIPSYCSENLQNCVTYGTSDLSEQDVLSLNISGQCERERGRDQSLLTIASIVINSRNGRYFRVRSLIHSTSPIAWQLSIAAWFRRCDSDADALLLSTSISSRLLAEGGGGAAGTNHLTPVQYFSCQRKQHVMCF